MDPLDIMMDLEKVIPYYQPVVRADKQLVSGFEVIPYFNGKRLSWFLEDHSIPDDFQLELTNYIFQRAIDTFLETDQALNLFFQYPVPLLIKDNGESLLSLLDFYSEKGLKREKIIITVKEADIPEPIDDVKLLFTYMKTLGIGVAVDAGRRNANIERIALLKPTIIKIDTGFLDDEYLPYSYREVHHTLAMLSRKIGASLLFRNISSFQQLNYAWRNGGEFYEGSYLKGAEPEYADISCCKDKIKEDFHHFVQVELRNMKAQITLTNEINEQLSTILKHVKPHHNYDEIVLKVGEASSHFCFRVYICNEKGIQLSSNAEKTVNGNWELRPEDRNKNWSWRPYFFENIIRMNMEKKGLLSDLYADIERGEQIRTYAYPLSKNSYIFLDISYNYLYEREGLL